MNNRLSSRRKVVFFLGWLAAFLLHAALPSVALAQNIQWLRQFGTEPGVPDEVGNAVATSPSGVYVAGYTRGTFPGQTNLQAFQQDPYVARYDALGNQIWVRQFGSTGGVNDVATGVAADATGVYVVGWTNGTLPQQTGVGRTDSFVRKYDVNGTEQWTRQFGTSFNDQALAVAVNATGVYVVGVVEGALPGQTLIGASDAYVRKYDANGNELLTRQFGTGDQEQATGVALDATGIYISGWTVGALDGPSAGTDGFVRKFDLSGNVVWTRRFGSISPAGGAATDNAYAVAVGPSGVYVAGVVFGTVPGQTKVGGLNDAYVIKFDLNGAKQWENQFGTDRDDIAYGIAVGTNAVFVTGVMKGQFPGVNPQEIGIFGGSFVRLYDFNGAVLGTRQFGDGFGYGAAADITGAYACGEKSDSTFAQVALGGRDAFLVKVLPAPVTFDTSVVSTASFIPAPAPVAPGSIATVFGVYVNDGSLVGSSAFGPEGRLVTRLGEASVTLNGIPAPMLFSFPGQLAIQIPYELEGLSSATLQVTVGGQAGAASTIRLDSIVPGVFTLSNDGRGAAAVLHQDGTTVVTAQNPARPGEIVVLYATGLGAVNPPLATGAPSAGNRTVAATTVSVGGIASPQIDFSGASPGFVGLYQVNFQIPPNAPTGSTQPLVLTVGGKAANPVTIAVGP